MNNCHDEERAIDLHEGKTLKGYGRRQHGLNGKDADLDVSGQNVVKSALWFDDGTILIEGYRYALICPDADWTEALAMEIIVGSGYPGEWIDDCWELTDRYSLKLNHDWNDALTEEQNITLATDAAFKAIDADSHAFERAIDSAHATLARVQS